MALTYWLDAEEALHALEELRHQGADISQRLTAMQSGLDAIECMDRRLQDCERLSPTALVAASTESTRRPVWVKYLCDYQPLSAHNEPSPSRNRTETIARILVDIVGRTEDGGSLVAESFARQVAYLTVDRLRAEVERLRGLAAYLEADFKRAIRHLLNATDHWDALPATWDQLGMAYAMAHEADNAIRSWERYLEMTAHEHDDPRRPEVEKLLDQARAGLLGQKEFGGSWKILFVLAGLMVLGVWQGVRSRDMGYALASLVVWGGSVALYFWFKYK
jgi:hypothetical protein